MVHPLAADLDDILSRTHGLWDDVRGQRLFITGGTGFFGCWLLESFAWANDRLGLKASAVVLTRGPEAFGRKAPHLAAHPAIRLHQGDVRGFEFPAGSFSHVIHAATEASAQLNLENPGAMIDTIWRGTREVLKLAQHCGAKRFMLASSGAVYGKQPAEITHLPETYPGGPDPMSPAAAYGEGKRLAELLGAVHAREHGMDVTIARCFAFVGPYLPLNTHFAIGNFIRDALDGGPIRVQGDGTASRSYLYAPDLAVWLWTILLRAQSCRPYNVGSEQALTVAELAREVAHALDPNVAIETQQPVTPGRPPDRYVPSCQRATNELGLSQTTSLNKAILRTARWHTRGN